MNSTSDLPTRRTTLSRIGAFLTWRPIAFFIVIAIGAAIVNVFLTVTAPSKLDDELASITGTDSTTAVAVELGFPPEEFHLQELQAYGTVSSVEGNDVNLIQVEASDVSRIARKYWVSGLRHTEGR